MEKNHRTTMNFAAFATKRQPCWACPTQGTRKERGATHPERLRTKGRLISSAKNLWK